MKPEPLVEARLIRRYKRFLADVEFPDGEVTTVHCPNTGAMTGCAEHGSRVWLQFHKNPQRKYCWTWVMAESAAGDLIWIHSVQANRLLEEALLADLIPELHGYPHILREFQLENGERIDFLLRNKRQECLVEVKCVTLLTADGGRFPDAVSQRATRHLDALMAARRSGRRAVLFYACLHTGITSVAAAEDIDPVYAQQLNTAISVGVEVIAYGADISTREVKLSRRLPVLSTLAVD